MNATTFTRSFSLYAYAVAVLAGALLPAAYCYSQHKEYYIRHYNGDNGLPQNSIKSLKIDKRGYVWLATEAGLVRYDGANFKLYNKTTGGKFINRRMATLYLSNADTIYFIVEGSTFYKMNKGNFPETFIPGKEELQTAGTPATLNPYVLYNSCISRLDKGGFQRWILPDLKLLAGSTYNSLAFLHNRYYYLNADRELISADTALWDFKKITLKGFDVEKPAGNTPLPVSIMQQDDELFLRWGGFIYKTHFTKNQQQLNGDTLLWVGNMPGVTAFANYRHSNLFMVGTQTDGLFIYKESDFATLTFKNKEDNVFYAQAPYGVHSVLTAKGILPEGKNTHLTDYKSTVLLKTWNGHYLLNRWVSREVAEISELDSNLNEINFTREADLVAHVITQLKDSSILIAAEQKFLGKLDKGLISWIKPPPLLDTFDIMTLAEISPVEFFIGGYHGLAKINIKSGESRLYGEMANLNIRSLYLDARGVLWIGTYGNGYYALYKDKFIQMPKDRDNYLLNTHAFMVDKKGFCWMPTNQGLFQARVADMYDFLDNKIAAVYYQYYDRTSGFITNEFNGGCQPPGIQLNNGWFSFPSMNGLVQFDPQQVQPVLPNNAIYTDEVLSDTLALDPASNRFTFSNKTQQIKITVSSPFFGTSYNHYIQYQLKGLDTAWQELAVTGEMSFKHLTTGNYELILKKQSGFGNASIEKHLFFTVEPSFYETWIFRILLAAFIIVKLFMLFGLRLRMLVRQRMKLENEVAERTKEQHLLIESLETTVQELEQSREQLFQNAVFLEKLAMIITHDLQSPLRFLSDASKRINLRAKQNDFTSVTELGSEIQKSSSTIHSFVEDFGLWIKAFGKNFQVKKQAFELTSLLYELHSFFSEQLKMQGNVLEIILHRHPVIKTDRQLLLIILRNLIDNANKFTRQGIINVEVSEHDGFASISITDTGPGIKADVLRNLHSLINEPLLVTNKDNKIGYGYQFIADFCKLLELKITIETTAPAGTHVQLSNLPVA